MNKITIAAMTIVVTMTIAMTTPPAFAHGKAEGLRPKAIAKMLHRYKSSCKVVYGPSSTRGVRINGGKGKNKWAIRPTIITNGWMIVQTVGLMSHTSRTGAPYWTQPGSYMVAGAGGTIPAKSINKLVTLLRGKGHLRACIARRDKVIPFFKREINIGPGTGFARLNKGPRIRQPG